MHVRLRIVALQPLSTHTQQDVLESRLPVEKVVHKPAACAIPRSGPCCSYRQRSSASVCALQVLNTKDQMSAGLAQLIEAKAHRRRAAQKKAITFVSGVGLIGAGAGISATGAGAVIGIPMAIVGAGIAGAAAAL